MMKPILVLILVTLFLYSCGHSPEKPLSSSNQDMTKANTPSTTDNENTLDISKIGLNLTPKSTYDSIKSTIPRDKVYFKTYYSRQNERAIDSAAQYLYSKLVNDIVPHWYGTAWDFNGHTDIPNEGNIACGYFVSTTLKHLGFNLNRYKMAQQAGLNIAMALQQKSEIKTYRNISYDDLKTKINAVYKDGIYFVALDNHVGYILIKDRSLYFLHSSYCDYEVMIEPAKTSPCFVSDIYVFAEVTTNKALVKKWIFNEALVIPN
ncbi:MAG: hypothetical protein AAF901_08185 [Bacteroidota bacterium]